MKESEKALLSFKPIRRWQMNSLLTPQEIEDFNDADYKTWGEFKRALVTTQDLKSRRKLVEWIEENKLIPNEQCYAVPTEEHKRSCKVCKWQALRKDMGIRDDDPQCCDMTRSWLSGRTW